MQLDELYGDVLEIVSTAGARVDVPVESEEFFSKIVREFDGSREDLLKHISSNIETWFPCLNARPRWIQEAEWQFHDGKPMTFMGQIDVNAATGVFHDDASIFVFVSLETGVSENVIQVA